MLSLCEDNILKISEYLSDYDKINLSMISKLLIVLKYKYAYVDKIHVDKIIMLPFYHNFRSVEITNLINKNMPSNVNNVYFVAKNNLVPSIVTHLTICKWSSMYIQENIISNEHILNKLDTYNHQIKWCTMFFKRNTIFIRVARYEKAIYFEKAEYDIANKIQLKITHLSFETNHDNLIRGIPKTVIHLIFGDRFNQSIHQLIPQSVTHLTFGHNFNREIGHDIPPSVTHLTFGYNFNREINNSIPPSVTHLTFGHCFNKILGQKCIKKRFIPKSVTHLTFGNKFNNPISGYLCLVGVSYKYIPSSVIRLTFGNDFNQKIEHDTYFGCAHKYIPSSVTYLELGNNFDQSLCGVPQSVGNLKINGRYNPLIQHLIMDSVLNKIYLRNDKIKTYLPYLMANDIFRQKINNVFIILRQKKEINVAYRMSFAEYFIVDLIRSNVIFDN